MRPPGHAARSPAAAGQPGELTSVHAEAVCAAAAHTVAVHWRIPVGLLRACGDREVARVRQIAMWLARQHGVSLPRIGRWWRRHHTTVLHAIRQVAARRAADESFARLTDRLLRLCQTAGRGGVGGLPTPAVLAAMQVLARVVEDRRARRALAERIVARIHTCTTPDASRGVG